MQNYQIEPNQVMHENIDGEVIVIHVETGNYHSLRFVATDIWLMIDANYTTEQIIQTLSNIYPEHTNTIPSDVVSFLESLATEDLIQTTNPTTTASTINTTKQTNGYVQPEVETYTDLQGLLLVDPIHDVTEDGWPRTTD